MPFITRPTVRDPRETHQQDALAQVATMQRCRIAYDKLLQDAIATYGDGDGRDISGIYRSHFPDAIKAELRQLLDWLNHARECALADWHASGRKVSTLRPLLDAARELPGGRVSYY